MIEQKLHNLIGLANTYIGEAPIGVDNCQWIKSASGTTVVHFAKGNYDKPTYSIYVRAKKNEDALNRIRSIFEKVRNQTDARSAILATRMPSFVGKDDKNRSIYTFQIEYQTGSY